MIFSASCKDYSNLVMKYVRLMMYQHFYHHIPWASCKREGEENEQNSFGAEISHDCRSHQIPKLHPSCKHLQSSAYLWHMSPGHDDKGNEHKSYDDASN